MGCGARFRRGLFEEIDSGEMSEADFEDKGVPPVPTSAAGIDAWVNTVVMRIDMDGYMEYLFSKGVVSDVALIDPTRDWNAVAFAQSLKDGLADGVRQRL